MQRSKRKILAAKMSALAISIALNFSSPVYAGLPVVDGTNLVHNIMSAMEAVAQTAKQIQQYQIQLQQYENQLKNSMAPAAQIWDQAQRTINDLNQATNTLAYYQNQVGSLDAYLGKFQDVAYYRSSPCFSASGCSDAEQAAMAENRRLASESQKRANDALFKGLEQQQNNLESDSKQLSRLQTAAQGADGQLAAIGYANQLASNQANQLLQIRSLLITQQNAVASRMQAQADQESQYQATRNKLYQGLTEPVNRTNSKEY